MSRPTFRKQIFCVVEFQNSVDKYEAIANVYMDMNDARQAARDMARKRPGTKIHVCHTEHEFEVEQTVTERERRI